VSGRSERLLEIVGAVRARAVGLLAVPTYAVMNRVSRRRVVADGVPVVVSLTTFGRRTGSVHYALESIARGSTRPGRLILWLDDATLVATPPPALARLVRRGLELRATPDYGSHKKYYPYVVSVASHELPLVTADDDVSYPRWWLERLLAAHHSDTSSVWCYRARQVEISEDGAFRPYASWPRRHGTAASHLVLPTGTSGVLYPPALLDALRDEGDGFLEQAPRADDLWLHVIALRHGVPARQALDRARHFPLFPHDQARSLSVANQGGGNDTVLRHLYTEADRALLRN